MRQTIFILATIALIFTGCSRDSVENISGNQGTQLSKADQRISNASSDFGFEMMQQLHSDEPGENQVISPLSVSVALGMLYPGTEGQTREELKKGLGFENFTEDEIITHYKEIMTKLPALDEDVELSIANAVFHDQGFSPKQDYLTTVQDQFQSQITPLDFRNPQTPDVINDWVKDKTNGKIEKMVEQIPPQTVMYLMNALYFNGKWTNQFDEENTRNARFTKADGSKVEVPFMTKQSEWKSWRNESYTAVDLPYGNEKFSMTLLLPGEAGTLGHLINKLDAEMLKSIDQKLDSSTAKLEIPKFKLSYKKSLKELLSQMGMPTMFSEQEANLDGISESDLYVENVKHKTFIEVDEKGTEAAAATGVEIGITSVPPTISFDRPFLFLIREHDANNVIFAGKVMDPTADK